MKTNMNNSFDVWTYQTHWFTPKYIKCFRIFNTCLSRGGTSPGPTNGVFRVRVCTTPMFAFFIGIIYEITVRCLHFS